MTIVIIEYRLHCSILRIKKFRPVAVIYRLNILVVHIKNYINNMRIYELSERNQNIVSFPINLANLMINLIKKHAFPEYFLEEISDSVSVLALYQFRWRI